MVLDKKTQPSQVKELEALGKDLLKLIKSIKLRYRISSIKRPLSIKNLPLEYINYPLD